MEKESVSGHRFEHERFGKSLAGFVDAELTRAEARAITD
jgi:hypothetical protein